MLAVSCPFCQEKGRIPATFVGKRIRCGKCENKFLVTPPPAKGAAAAPSAEGSATPPAGTATGHAITIEGMEAGTWEAPAVATAETHAEADLHAKGAPSVDHHLDHEPQGVFTDSAAEHHADLKEYKLLTQKDKWFEGKFELGRLEAAINHYSHLGWTVKAMTTAQVAGFSGGIKEELIVLLER
jgi:hypothetical protein